MKYLFLLPICLMGCTSTIAINEGYVPTIKEEAGVPVIETPVTPEVPVEKTL